MIMKKKRRSFLTLHVHSRRRNPLTLSKQTQLLSKARPELRSPKQSFGCRRCCGCCCSCCCCCLFVSPLIFGKECSRQKRKNKSSNNGINSNSAMVVRVLMLVRENSYNTNLLFRKSINPKNHIYVVFFFR